MRVNWKECDFTLAEFQTVLKLQPGFAQAHYKLGGVYRQQGQVADAKKEFEQALQLKPDFFEARQSLEALSR